MSLLHRVTISSRPWPSTGKAKQRKPGKKVSVWLLLASGLCSEETGVLWRRWSFRFAFSSEDPWETAGSGFSWIHIEDLCRAAHFVMTDKEISGPVNFTAPGPVRNRDLARAIGKVLRRPSIMPAPAFMIRLLMGEFGSVILGDKELSHAYFSRRASNSNLPISKPHLRTCWGPESVEQNATQSETPKVGCRKPKALRRCAW